MPWSFWWIFWREKIPCILTPGSLHLPTIIFCVKSVVKACQAERPASTLWGFLDVRFIAPVNWQVVTGKPHEMHKHQQYHSSCTCNTSSTMEVMQCIWKQPMSRATWPMSWIVLSDKIKGHHPKKTGKSVVSALKRHGYRRCTSASLARGSPATVHQTSQTISFQQKTLSWFINSLYIPSPKIQTNSVIKCHWICSLLGSSNILLGSSKTKILFWSLGVHRLNFSILTYTWIFRRVFLGEQAQQILHTWKIQVYISYTPRKINIEPQNDGLEDDSPFPGVKTLRFHVNLPGCTTYNVTQPPVENSTKDPPPSCGTSHGRLALRLWLLETNGNLRVAASPCMVSGQIIILHQPRFPWNKGISLTKPPFGVRSCEVAIIRPDVWYIYFHLA